MEINGWNINDITADEQYCMVNDPESAIECHSSPSWYGWGCESSSGKLSTTLKGSGIMNIQYGNCWDGGYVKVYVNDILQDSAVGHKYKETSFEYDEGTTVSITDEEGYAAIKLISVSFACKGKYHTSYGECSFIDN